MMSNILAGELSRRFKLDESGIYASDSEGYWSNLSKEENVLLLRLLKTLSAKEALLRLKPDLVDIVYSPMRDAGLELLELNGDETCIDYGCMWGALTVALARRTAFVLGIDQTKSSLNLLKSGVKDENLNNIELLCADLRKLPVLDFKVDIAIANGVLEWIPERGLIELKNYFGKYNKKEIQNNPGIEQLEFLQNAYKNIKPAGKLYLGIENRYDFKMFLGVGDPHVNIPCVSFFPRRLSSAISVLLLGRPYVNWLYSFKGTEVLLKKAGFSKVDLYMCFPDYRFPERIIPYNKGLDDFTPTINLKNSAGKITPKRFLGRVAETLIFKIIKAKFLSPSIIAIAHK